LPISMVAAWRGGRATDIPLAIRLGIPRIRADRRVLRFIVLAVSSSTDLTGSTISLYSLGEPGGTISIEFNFLNRGAMDNLGPSQKYKSSATGKIQCDWYDDEPKPPRGNIETGCKRVDDPRYISFSHIFHVSIVPHFVYCGK